MRKIKPDYLLIAAVIILLIAVAGLYVQREQKAILLDQQEHEISRLQDENQELRNVLHTITQDSSWNDSRYSDDTVTTYNERRK
jgi:hypothetical protein